MKWNLTAIRQPAWAGQFYPGESTALHRAVQGYLAAAKRTEGTAVKAIVAPHAGYDYSGPIAGSAFSSLIGQDEVIRRIVLMGPSHRVAFSGLASSSAQAFATPLGSIPLDQETLARLEDLPQVNVLDRAHAAEHSLEVELPFLQETLGDFLLVPLLVGDATAAQAAEVLDRLWGGPETRIVVSSDLSHYLDYNSAIQLDRATAHAIEALDPGIIAEDQACGRVPLCGLLLAARQHGLRAHTVDLRNSGDTAGPRNEVVGYGAFVFNEG